MKPKLIINYDPLINFINERQDLIFNYFRDCKGNEVKSYYHGYYKALVDIKMEICENEDFLSYIEIEEKNDN